MAFVYFPNGAIPARLVADDGEGEKDFTLNRTMQPLEAVKQQIQVISGLDHVNATPGPDGAGDHARASGTFLTGVRVKKTAGVGYPRRHLDRPGRRQPDRPPHPLPLARTDLRRRAPVGQLRLRLFLRLSVQPRLAVAHDAGPARAESPPPLRAALRRRRARRAQGEPQESRQPPALDPRLRARRRPRPPAEARGARPAKARRVPDERPRDRGANRPGRAARREGPRSRDGNPRGHPADFEAYIQLMFDMLVLAFQTDSTRVATFLLANEGSNRAFPEIGIAEGHHYLTHHRNQEDMIDKVAEIDLFYMKQFAQFLEKMEQTKDVDGNSLLHNSMIVYGSGNADGNRHTHVNLPIILAGGGGGSLARVATSRPAASPCRTCSSAWPTAWASRASTAWAIPRVGWCDLTLRRPEDSMRRTEMNDSLSRRRFLEAAAVAAVAAPAVGAGAGAAAVAIPTRPFGKTGMEVSILGFGSGSRFLMYEDEDKALEALGRAIDLGITYIDTAHAYGNGKSEERIGRLMPARRKEVTLATKLSARKARRRQASDRAEPQAAPDRPPRRPAHPRAEEPRRPRRDRGARRRPEGPLRGARPEGGPGHRHHLPRRPRRAQDGAGAARLRLHADGPQRRARPHGRRPRRDEGHAHARGRLRGAGPARGRSQADGHHRHEGLRAGPDRRRGPDREAARPTPSRSPSAWRAAACRSSSSSSGTSRSPGPSSR